MQQVHLSPRLTLSVLCGVLVLAVAGWVWTSRQAGHPEQVRFQGAGKAAAMRAADTLARLPLAFVANHGQAPAPVDFVGHGLGYALALTPAEAVLSFTPSKSGQSSSSLLRMQLVGGSVHARSAGLDTQPGQYNYLFGNQPDQWRTGVPAYGKVRYRNVYPGIDVAYYGRNHELEHDFILAPGADAKNIRLHFDGADRLRLHEDGRLELQVSGNSLFMKAPEVYQETDGVRHTVAGRYVLLSERDVGFEIGAYDHGRTLVIDPVLSVSTYLGGGGNDIVTSMAMDGSGNIYLAGHTSSLNFPVSPSTQAPKGQQDAFLVKLDNTGKQLLYSIYFGGIRDDSAADLAVDAAGNAYLFGNTTSADFPVRGTPLQPSYGGNGDAFVAKFDPSGTVLYSKYLGGSGTETAAAIALDSAGNVYVTGGTLAVTDAQGRCSNNFPVNNGSSCVGGNDIFIGKLDTSGALVYAAYYGGAETDAPTDIAVGSSGNYYVVGVTSSVAFTDAVTTARFGSGQICSATSPSGHCTSGGGSDAFISVFNADNTLRDFTFWGGNGLDRAEAVAVDSAGSIYVAGYTSSTINLYVSPNAIQSGNRSTGSGSYDAFVVKIKPDFSAAVYSTYLGGDGDDKAYALAVDETNNTVYIAGETTSTNFPLANSLQNALMGGSDAFVSSLKLDSIAGMLSQPFSTYFGGSGWSTGDAIYDIALQGGKLHAAGATNSVDDLPLVVPMQSMPGGSLDAFFSKIDLNGPVSADLQIFMTDTPDPASYSAPYTYQITVTNADFVYSASDVVVVDTFPGGVSVTSAPANCKHSQTNTYTCRINALAARAYSTLTFTVTSSTEGKVYNTARIVRANESDPDATNNTVTVETTILVGRGGRSGAMGGWELLALLSFVAIVCRRNSRQGTG